MYKTINELSTTLLEIYELILDFTIKTILLE